MQHTVLLFPMPEEEDIKTGDGRQIKVANSQMISFIFRLLPSELPRLFLLPLRSCFDPHRQQDGYATFHRENIRLIQRKSKHLTSPMSSIPKRTLTIDK